jgi:hypothetical protein
LESFIAETAAAEPPTHQSSEIVVEAAIRHLNWKSHHRDYY